MEGWEIGWDLYENGKKQMRDVSAARRQIKTDPKVGFRKIRKKSNHLGLGFVASQLWKQISGILFSFFISFYFFLTSERERERKSGGAVLEIAW
jgi:hypothetical protein